MQQIYYESSRFDTHSEMKQLHKGLFLLLILYFLIF